MDHFQPGFAVVGGMGCAWANTQAGMRATTSERMLNTTEIGLDRLAVGDSIRVQCDSRIDARGAERGKNAGHDSDRSQHNDRADRYRRIVSVDAEELRAHGLRGSDGEN